MEDGKLVWKMNLRGVAENYSRLGEVLNAGRPFVGPTQFIRGGKSNYLTATDEPEIRRLFPAAQIQVIPAAGHWVHADSPEEFLRLALDFL